MPPPRVDAIVRGVASSEAGSWNLARMLCDEFTLLWTRSAMCRTYVILRVILQGRDVRWARSRWSSARPRVGVLMPDATGRSGVRDS